MPKDEWTVSLPIQQWGIQASFISWIGRFVWRPVRVLLLLLTGVGIYWIVGLLTVVKGLFHHWVAVAVR